jgi:glycerophosphoryl diester phosphodiesterase
MATACSSATPSSADGVLFLLHDATLERTTNGQGIAGKQPWASWPSWTPAAGIRAPMPASPAHAGALARWCLPTGTT